jgi:YtoQ family protein
MKWTVYLSGEIHTDWRDQIIAAAEKLELPIEFCSAVTQHEASDAAGDGGQGRLGAPVPISRQKNT